MSDQYQIKPLVGQRVHYIQDIAEKGPQLLVKNPFRHLPRISIKDRSNLGLVRRALKNRVTGIKKLEFAFRADFGIDMQTLVAMFSPFYSKVSHVESLVFNFHNCFQLVEGDLAVMARLISKAVQLKSLYFNFWYCEEMQSPAIDALTKQIKKHKLKAFYSQLHEVREVEGPTFAKFFASIHTRNLESLTLLVSGSVDLNNDSLLNVASIIRNASNLNHLGLDLSWSTQKTDSNVYLDSFIKALKEQKKLRSLDLCLGRHPSDQSELLKLTSEQISDIERILKNNGETLESLSLNIETLDHHLSSADEIRLILSALQTLKGKKFKNLRLQIGGANDIFSEDFRLEVIQKAIGYFAEVLEQLIFSFSLEGGTSVLLLEEMKKIVKTMKNLKRITFQGFAIDGLRDVDTDLDDEEEKNKEAEEEKEDKENNNNEEEEEEPYEKTPSELEYEEEERKRKAAPEYQELKAKKFEYQRVWKQLREIAEEIVGNKENVTIAHH